MRFGNCENLLDCRWGCVKRASELGRFERVARFMKQVSRLRGDCGVEVAEQLDECFYVAFRGMKLLCITRARSLAIAVGVDPNGAAGASVYGCQSGDVG